MCSDLKRRGDYVKTSCPPCFSMEYMWSVCRDLAGGFFSTDLLKTLTLLLRNKLMYYSD